MSRIVTVGAAQLGPIQRTDSRPQVVKRLLDLLHQAKAHGCDLVVYPELALTTFFPRWWMEDQREIDAFFEREMPGLETRPLFDEARRLSLGMCLGYAELATDPDGRTRRFNTSILADQTGRLVGKYRKIHLPGHAEHEPWRAFQHLEKRYFEVGDLGWKVWPAFGGLMGLCICNDRRWPETYRVMGLQGVEMVLLGYNTPVHNPPAPEHDLHALQPHHPVRLGPAPVVADAQTHEAAEGRPDFPAEVAHFEVTLFQMLKGTPRLVLGMTGEMDLAVFADEAAGLVHQDRGVEASRRASGLAHELGIAETEV